MSRSWVMSSTNLMQRFTLCSKQHSESRVMTRSPNLIGLGSSSGSDCNSQVRNCPSQLPRVNCLSDDRKIHLRKNKQESQERSNIPWLQFIQNVSEKHSFGNLQNL